MDEISKRLKRHYETSFDEHGATSSGVDWGEDSVKLELRYEKMLATFRSGETEKISLLDVGCGYGGLLQHARRKGIEFDYTGIDLAENMIDWARSNLAGQGNFLLGDVLNLDSEGSYDYVVCNGILTQKLETEGGDMDRYAGELIKKLYFLCRKGAAFNVMTTKVNYFSNNLYYRNPAEMLGWCLTELTPSLRLDHSYPLYEYTVYLYRPYP